MSGHFFIGWGVLLLAGLVSGQVQPQQPGGPPPPPLKSKLRGAGATDRASTPSSAPYGPTAPPEKVPLLPGEMAAVQPRVSYREGLLTIEAPNSTLVSVISAIHQKTGIQFENLQGATERVVIRMGPAPVGEVINELLRSSQFDYVILGREGAPNIVQRVILTPKSGAPASAFAPTPAPPPPPTPQTAANDTPEVGDDSDDDPDNIRTPSVRMPSPPSAQQQARSPQEMLEEMQQKELQRRQQQQNASKPNAAKPDDPPL